MHHEKNVGVTGGLDLMYEREVLMIILGLAPILFGIYYGYKHGYLYFHRRNKT